MKRQTRASVVIAIVQLIAAAVVLADLFVWRSQ